MSLLGRLTHRQVKNEYDRYKSQTAKILHVLKNEENVTTVRLERIAFNYTARISGLRKEGHVILASYLKPGVWRYTYKGQK